jgi:hypothetical protein
MYDPHRFLMLLGCGSGWEHAMGVNRQDKAGGKQAFD